VKTRAKQQVAAMAHHAGLYGDDAGPAGALDLHVEELQARAQALGYAVKPHMHPNLLQLFVALAGRCIATIDGQVHQLAAPCMVSIPGGIAHCFEFGADARGWILTVAHERVIAAPLNRNADNVASLLREPQIVESARGSPQAQGMASLMGLLHQEFHAGHTGREACLEYLLRLILVHHWREAEHSRPAGIHADRDRKLFYDFRALVELHYPQHWTMTDYTAALRCSQPRLNRVCRQFSGRNANRIVLDRLCEEAKRLLTFTTAPATSIGNRLGFQEPSYFTRFFKQRVRKTPGEFRAGLAGGQRGAKLLRPSSRAN
jgi:AraC family transcriptional activator of pobA